MDMESDRLYEIVLSVPHAAVICIAGLNLHMVIGFWHWEQYDQTDGSVSSN
jgi:hypothetical protein